MSAKAELASPHSEQRALAISKWGNLFMAAAGVLAAWLSNSTAVLMDGLFSLIGFSSAILGARISARLAHAPDRFRPIGYAADEAIYQTFRALSLLGLILFAFFGAVIKIADYAQGGEVTPLNYATLYVYFPVVSAVCFGLALTHLAAWRKSGRTSAMLRMEAKASAFDGVMTLAAGAGLAVFPFLAGTSLGWISPIGDSIVVIVLCSMAVGRYYSDFTEGVGELAGASAAPEKVRRAKIDALQVIHEFGGKLIDFSVIKLGRTAYVQVYLDPERPITADLVDDLTRKLDAVISQSAGNAISTVLISRHGRNFGRTSD